MPKGHCIRHCFSSWAIQLLPLPHLSGLPKPIKPESWVHSLRDFFMMESQSAISLGLEVYTPPNPAYLGELLTVERRPTLDNWSMGRIFAKSTRELNLPGILTNQLPSLWTNENVSFFSPCSLLRLLQVLSSYCPKGTLTGCFVPSSFLPSKLQDTISPKGLPITPLSSRKACSTSTWGC